MSKIYGEGVNVEFPIYESSHRSLKKTIINATTGGYVGKNSRNHVVVKALDNLNFRFDDGDRVGLIGHNGSGKTTLLRVIAGIYEPVHGVIQVDGRVASLLDVSMGLDEEATGYENIFLRGVISGLKPQVIRKHVQEIAEFSELGEYLDLPVRTYSSGMKLRLGFSISTSIQADILIMDEWLSVGDKAFGEKASNKLQEAVDSASILVLASHSEDLIRKVCNRVIRLEHGRIVSDGPV